MRKYLILLLLLCQHVVATRGQTPERPDLSGLPVATTAQSLRYWFDDQTTNIQTLLGTSGTYSIDVSALDEGLHTLYCQVVDNQGGVSFIKSSLFLKLLDNKLLPASTTAQSLRYWFDDDQSTMKTVNVAQGTQVIDVSGMEAGIHTLYYQLVDITGNLSTPVVQLFLKPFPAPEVQGDNHITKYEYWMNSMSSSLKTITVDNASNPYQLTSLVPMPKEIIRSQSFHFEIVDGSLMLYAKNDFNIRFHDARGYFVQQAKSFIDYSVSQAITDIEPLEPDVRATTEKPDQNAIKWYCLQAEAGDSLQFKLDHAASIQLFAPSGDEVYHVSGSGSVKWGGLHAKEDGTYYLALHDVTATSGSTISIDYSHIDKYAILRQDVSVVGNGGCSTITFEGNGFQDLYAVELYNDAGESINHVNIGHESDATTSVTFDFSNFSTGTYNALFHFTEEDKIFTDLVTVEEAKDVVLSLEVKCPNTYLRGTYVNYTVSISNKGNSTAYCVPLEIQFQTHSKDAISDIKIKGNIQPLDVDWLDNSIFPQDSIDGLKQYIKQKGDFLHFITIYDPISDCYIKDGHFSIEIAPYSTYELTFSVKSNERTEIQVLAPSKWLTCLSAEQSSKVRKTRGMKEDMCCVREKVECIMNLAVGALDFWSIVGGPQLKIADCIASLGNTTLQYAYDVWCGEGLNGKKPKKAADDLIWDAVNGLIGCLCTYTGIDKFNIQWIYQHIYNNISITADCLQALTQKVPNCPPNPENRGGSSTPVVSKDPNEIYGYTAESGSKDVKDGQTDVYYTIQFENDPTFATAPAHDIYLTDNLDVDKFDLSTFCPTSVRIGDKTAELDGAKNFVTTLDMRPEIYAIAQVEGTFDEQTGNASWHISTLDPMTMEPTTDAMIGVLPVNNDGLGIGEVSYNISLKPDLAHGSEVKNQASIVFDNNEEILTPVWTNVIDKVAPESRITAVEQQDESTASVSVNITDELSGPWRYDVYVQYGTGSAWMKAAENIPAGSNANVKIYEGINHGFYVVAKDMAGNVELKEAVREYTLITEGAMPGDVNGDGKVTITDAVAIISYIRGENPQGFIVSAADINGDEQITLVDAVMVIDSILKAN